MSLIGKLLFYTQSSQNSILKNYKNKVDLVGFHGQTIYHNSEEKITRQLGDGKLLSQLLKNCL